MNEAFEKILERLEEYEYEHLVGHDSEMANHCKQDCNDVNDCTLCVWDKAIEIVKQEAEKFGTDINVVSNGWIPCSERLPEEELEKAKKERGSEAVFPVLATINKKHIVTGEKYTTVSRAFYGCYNDKNFYNACCDKLDVIAWQPLPEPYKERD